MGFNPLQEDTPPEKAPPLRIESGWSKKLLSPDIFFEWHPQVKKLYRCQPREPGGVPHGYLLAQDVATANEAANLVRCFVQGAMVALGINESNADNVPRSEGTA